MPRYTARQRRIVKDRGKINSLRLPVFNGGPRIEHLYASNHIVYFAEAKLRHVLTHLLGHEEKEIDDVFRLTAEFFAKLWVLRGDAHGTSIQVAFAQHDATQCDERSGGETVFFRAEQCGDDHVTSGLQLTVGLYADAAAQVVHQQDLLRLSEPKLPWTACVLDRTQGRSTRAAAVAADEHNIGMRLRHSGGNCTDANFGDELHGDAGLGVRVLQVVDQLRQIDLEFVGIDEIIRGHAEARGRHLLDGAAAQVAVGIGLEAILVFPALAGVRFSANAVHGDGERLVRFFTNRTKGHCAGR